PYIGMAYAQGYRKVFYNGRTDLLSADVVKLSKDTSNINFVLLPVPNVALGSISGAVIDSSSRAGVTSRIIAYRDKKDRGRQDAYFADTDTTGKYSVNDLPPGDYYVLAMPLGHYAPSFYSIGGPTTKWKEATKVSVNGNAVSGIDIYVLSMRKSSNGYTTVQGSVTTRTGVNKLSGGFAKTGAVEGVNGTIVYAVDNSGTVASYGITGADGSYTIPSLAPQTYTVYTDRIGFEVPIATVASPTYDDQGNSLPATASFDLSQTATGIDDPGVVVPQEYSLAQNYPNPFNPSTKISFSLPAADRISLVVYNILGQKVATVFEGEMQAGTHILNWNANNDNGIALSTGVYFYQLRVSQFVATKKMVLLK
ncbi:MAG: T9SS type A sorting domain-containing protein, partial [Ignavibacteriales bacterium]|nr:T9SS type A sorting domain-containing protein [Ignavibacteriales bacterium]